MKKLLLALALMAMPLVACSSRSTATTSDTAREASKDWSERRTEWVDASQKKLDKIYADVQSLEKSGKLANSDNARKARNDGEELREDIVELKKELNDDARKVSADDWEKERLDYQSDINELEQDYADFKGYYRR